MFVVKSTSMQTLSEFDFNFPQVSDFDFNVIICELSVGPCLLLYSLESAYGLVQF